MITANVHDAKTNLSKLLAKVAEGERVVITNRGTPVAELSKPKDKSPKKQKPYFGMFKGEIEIPDNFEWTNEEIEELFYGPLEPKA
jgi:antitoxin (DNA-binding transcriptional repressor) of toxin-antitoxin stability system